MAMFIFAKASLAGGRIKIFNHGKMRRDFLHSPDDRQQARGSAHRSSAGGRPDRGLGCGRPGSIQQRRARKIYKSGNGRPEELTYVVAVLEKEFLAKPAVEERIAPCSG